MKLFPNFYMFYFKDIIKYVADEIECNRAQPLVHVNDLTYYV